MCFIDDSGRWLLHSKTVVKYKNKGIDVNKNYLRTQGELLHNSQEMNDVELARAVVQAAQHSHGTKRLNRQLAGGGVFADAPEFKVTVIAAVCFAMAGVFSMPAQASSTAANGEYLDLFSGSSINTKEVDGTVCTINDFDGVTIKKEVLDYDIGGDKDVQFVFQGGHTKITHDQSYSGKTIIDSGYNNQVNVANGVSLLNSKAIKVERDSQIYFYGNKECDDNKKGEMKDFTIKALEGAGRVGMTAGLTLIVDYENRLIADPDDEEKNAIVIENQFLAQSKVKFTRQNSDRFFLKFNVLYTKDKWNVDAPEEDWGFESMTFENFYLDMDHDGTYKYLGLDNPTVTKRVNGNKNIHLANGSHMLFSPGSVDESAPESFNKKKYKLGGLYLEGGTLNFENLELDHTKFVKNADDSILTVKTLNFNSAEKSVNVNFAKQADSNFNLWENQNDESQNYLIRATTGVSQNEVEILNLAPDGLYTQTLNQTASSSDGDDAKLHWKVEDLGLKGNVLKYASTLQAIELLRTEDGSGFILNCSVGVRMNAPESATPYLSAHVGTCR